MKTYSLIIVFILLVFGKSFGQNNVTLPKNCYVKAVYLDSTSRTPASTTIDLSKPLPVIYVADGYACKCAITGLEVILVRGKRPVIQWSLSSPYVYLTNLTKLAQPDDRLIINVTNAVSGASRCLLMSTSPLFSATFK